MVLVVRGDLKMGKGKTAAQCAHASILCYEKCLHKNPKLLQIWTDTGQPKVVLKAESLSEMESIYRKANDANIVAALVRDAGRTQLPAGSVTVLGIGPDTIENIDQLAKHLKLL
ncbi:peptidyl-tRNA hydrolase 2, mitochondrial [Hermetia illucens]|nr:peptidyl-tRNA hydrolase 2, mitochondrial [Hermetia illucens]